MKKVKIWAVIEFCVICCLDLYTSNKQLTILLSTCTVNYLLLKIHTGLYMYQPSLTRNPCLDVTFKYHSYPG